MPTRKITEQLFTGGIDTLEQNHLPSVRPHLIIRIVESEELKDPVLKDYTVIDLPWDFETEPTPEILRKWLDAALPVLQQGKRVLILDLDGGSFSLDLLFVFMSVYENKTWAVCVQHVRDTCMGQASHYWLPSEKWKAGCTRHWLTAVKPPLKIESPSPLGRRVPPSKGPGDARSPAVEDSSEKEGS